MEYIIAKIANCRTASIRKFPWLTYLDEEIVAEVPEGDTVEIDPDDICYDWTDRKFYRTKNPSGWIHEGVIEYAEEG